MAFGFAEDVGIRASEKQNGEASESTPAATDNKWLP